MTFLSNILRRSRFSHSLYKPEIKKPERKTDVPHAVFQGYLFGGRMWPQTRGGINISLLHKWGTLAKGQPSDLLDLASSQLNAKQIKIDKAAMQADHNNAGVVLTVEVTDALMQKEWLKAKHAALLSIGQLVQKKYEKDVIPLSEKEIVQYARALTFDEKDLALLKKGADVAYDLVFKQHLGLSRLFVLTLFTKEQREFFYSREKSKFDGLCDYYQIPQLRTENIEAIQDACCKKITEILKKDPNPIDWISWGFENKKKTPKIETKESPVSVKSIASPVHPFSRSSERSKVEHVLFQELSSHLPVRITPYHWPDIDGIACTYALQELLHKKGWKDVVGMYAQTPQREAQWLMTKLGIEFQKVEDWMDKKTGNEQVILVDASDPTDLPATFPKELIRAVIDHRPYFNTISMPNAYPWISLVGSAATLVSELYLGQGLIPSPISAQLLYAAIMSNTIKCRTRNTTDKDRYMVNFLEKNFQLNESFIDEMFVAKSDLKDVPLHMRLFEDVSTKLRKFGDFSTTVAQLEIVGAEPLIQERMKELSESLQEIKRFCKGEKIFLVAIDVFKMKTFFYFEDEEIKKVVATKFAIKDCGNYSYIDTVVTRKDVISAFITQ